jgi:hypothetical protein
MKRRNILLLFAAVTLFSMAPVAMAQLCQRCAGGAPPLLHCAPAIRVPGTDYCLDLGADCFDVGNPCGGQGVAASLASDYKVVSVERVDEPKKSADIATVAPAETELSFSTR